jgi:hypothetical protein
MADGSQHSWGLVPETVYGVPVTTPVFANVPISKFSGGISMTKLVDDTIRGDRQITDVRNGAISTKFTADVKLRHTAYDAMLEALMCGTWTTNVVHQGVTYRSFTGERHFPDILDKPYHRQLGVEIDKLSLKAAKDSLISATFSCQAQTEIDAAAIITGATYGSIPTTTGPFDSFVATVSEGGSGIAVVTELDIDINNNFEDRRVIGTRLGRRPSKLLFDVNGSLTAYFEDCSLFDKFLASTGSNLSIVFTDPSANTMQFSIPNILYVDSAHRDVSGPGPIMVPLKFQARLDGGTGNTLSITRSS